MIPAHAVVEKNIKSAVARQVRYRHEIGRLVHSLCLAREPAFRTFRHAKQHRFTSQNNNGED